MPEARENAGDQVVISLRFASDWLKNVAQNAWSAGKRWWPGRD